MRTGEVTCKTILGHSGIGGVDYSVNPYIGCSHACAYCYAAFMRRMGHPGEPWGSFVDAKTNAVERLEAEAPRKQRGKVLLSSVTDPYQPLERKYNLTRRLLVVLRDNGYPVEILTKGDLVTRDIDVITEFDEAEVGMTITSLDDNVRQAFEPGASSVGARLRALKDYSDRGVPTYAFLGPMLPYLSDENLVELLDALADRVSRLMVDRLNIKCGNMAQIKAVLGSSYPDVAPMFEGALSLASTYYSDLRSRVKELCRERSLPVDVVYSS